MIHVFLNCSQFASVIAHHLSYLLNNSQTTAEILTWRRMLRLAGVETPQIWSSGSNALVISSNKGKDCFPTISGSWSTLAYSGQKHISMQIKFI
jgi:hypothetical protein